jgi:hypothetical protein
VESAKQQVSAALDPLISQLKSALSSSCEASAPTPASTPVNPEHSREAAAQLTRLLSEFDPGAADFIEAKRAELQLLFTDGDWADFEKLVQGYSFADAQIRLEQMLKNFPPA